MNLNFEALNNKLTDLIESIGISMETLWIIVGTLIIVSFFVGYWINKWAGSNRGFFATGLGLIFPWVLGVIIFLLALLNVESFMSDPTWFVPSSIMIGGLIFFIVLGLITPFLLGVDFFRALIVFLVNSIMVVACIYGFLKLVELASHNPKISKDPIVNKILEE